MRSETQYSSKKTKAAVQLLALGLSITTSNAFSPGFSDRHALKVDISSSTVTPTNLYSTAPKLRDGSNRKPPQPAQALTLKGNSRPSLVDLRVSSLDESTTRSSSTSLPDRIYDWVDDVTPEYLNPPRLVFDEKTVGLLVLLSVPMVWGTYVPVVRAMYEIDPPIPGSLFSFCYFTVAAFSSLSMLFINNKSEQGSDSTPRTSGKGTDVQKVAMENNQIALDGVQKSPETLAMSDESSLPWLIGVELGLYVFIANALQVVGVQTVPADRAGFLMQLSTIFVPLVQAARQGNILSVPSTTWTACALALAGIGVMGMDHSGVAATLDDALDPASSSLPMFSQGDLLLMASALLYTMNVVRLGDFSKRTTPVKLAAAKTVVESVVSGGFILGATAALASGVVDGETTSGVMQFLQQTGQEVSSFFSVVQERIMDGTLALDSIMKAGVATVWTGAMATTYVVMAQSYGQRHVSATDANLIYSLQPIFTALFAYILLGESMAPVGFVGATLIGSAVYMVASSPSSDSDAGADRK